MNFLISLFFLFQSPPTESILAAVNKNLSTINTLSGEIERNIKSTRRGEIKLKGFFYYKSPDKLRLNLSEEEIILNSETLLIREEKAKKYTLRIIDNPSKEMNEYLDFRNSFFYLTERFQFKKIWEGEVKRYKVFLFEGRPKTDTLFSKILLWIDKERFIPLRYETYTKGKNPTTIYVVDSLAKIDSIWLPLSYEIRKGTEEGVLVIKTLLQRLRLNIPLPNEIFEIRLMKKFDY